MAESVIYRYRLDDALMPGAKLPFGSRVLAVNPAEAEIWAEVPVSPYRTTDRVEVHVRVTGGEPAPGRYIGTFILPRALDGERFVGHVYAEDTNALEEK